MIMFNLVLMVLVGFAIVSFHGWAIVSSATDHQTPRASDAQVTAPPVVTPVASDLLAA